MFIQDVLLCAITSDVIGCFSLHKRLSGFSYIVTSIKVCSVFRSLLSISLFMMIGLLVYAGSPGLGGNASIVYDAKKEKIYSGKVERLSRKAFAGNGLDRSDYVFMTIKSSGGQSYECALGPELYLENSIELTKGDTVIRH